MSSSRFHSSISSSLSHCLLPSQSQSTASLPSSPLESPRNFSRSSSSSSAFLSTSPPQSTLMNVQSQSHCHSQSTVSPSVKSCLLIIDVQNDFLPGGALAVPNGDSIIPLINQLKTSLPFSCVVLSQDWHPLDHISFYETHRDKDPEHAQLFHLYTLENGEQQMLWPIHCVEHTHGAQFSSSLTVLPSDLVVQKGVQSQVDCYSAFYSNDKQFETPLRELLHSKGIEHVFCCGLALDYCVGSSAIDAANLGLKSYLIEDASQGIAQQSIQSMKERCEKAGVHIIQAKEIMQYLQASGSGNENEKSSIASVASSSSDSAAVASQ